MSNDKQIKSKATPSNQEEHMGGNSQMSVAKSLREHETIQQSLTDLRKQVQDKREQVACLKNCIEVIRVKSQPVNNYLPYNKEDLKRKLIAYRSEYERITTLCEERSKRIKKAVVDQAKINKLQREYEDLVRVSCRFEETSKMNRQQIQMQRGWAIIEHNTMNDELQEELEEVIADNASLKSHSDRIANDIEGLNATVTDLQMKIKASSSSQSRKFNLQKEIKAEEEQLKQLEQRRKFYSHLEKIRAIRAEQQNLRKQIEMLKTEENMHATLLEQTKQLRKKIRLLQQEREQRANQNYAQLVELRKKIKRTKKTKADMSNSITELQEKLTAVQQNGQKVSISPIQSDIVDPLLVKNASEGGLLSVPCLIKDECKDLLKNGCETAPKTKNQMGFLQFGGLMVLLLLYLLLIMCLFS